MADRLPPLTALRAFESAARHLSFAKAAEELNVTPAALSFQIKNLEEHLGAPLFHRLNRAVELTEAGRVLSPGASEGFERLAAAWRATRRLQDARALAVTAGPAFTAKCLAPRLYNFARAYPQIELRFVAGLRMMDFERDEIDVAIRYGYGADAGLYSEHLIDEGLTPMMRPELAARFTTPQSLIDAPLLHDASHDFLDPPANWAVWFRANGIDHTPAPTARFSQADHALDATLAGGGVVFTRTSVAQQYLASGQLVAPFDIALTTRARFRLLCAKGTEMRPQIVAFREWLSSEIRSLPTGLEGKTLISVEDLS
ncbi:transcriptional regulator GcvA [Maliponia aquimaris]|uniref:Glycine cleavage system transcriptional activator n=1 Tax=Maliponia aquimaris TaxID=1673631 RepID=A0A238K4N5_9RHOB|nr:transcriptional regulator GcvA [Maliponia aquimaris]SMX37829.1 Glycine cleavage system transcriptional activator [Maliponia aquimaris]